MRCDRDFMALRTPGRRILVSTRRHPVKASNSSAVVVCSLRITTTLPTPQFGGATTGRLQARKVLPHRSGHVLRVVTAAGLVFAATMSSFIFSDLQVLGQIGTTIGLGLLFDTLIVRSFMTPSIAAMLGRWFWWPQNVRPRPASQMLRPYGSRNSVRQLLEHEPADAD